MTGRIALSLAWCLTASICWAASLEQAEELYLSGDVDGARSELRELLATSEEDAERRRALKILGQIEVDQRRWSAALDAWGELTDRHALSPEAVAVSAAIRPLQALVECGCEPAAVGAVASAGGQEPPATTPAPAPAATPAPAPAPTPGLFMVGGWAPEYDAAQAVTRDLIEFLEANGIAVRAASTEIPAIRGADVVLSYLLEEARAAGAEGAIFLTSRFSHRDFIEIARYDLDGSVVWRDKTTGGTGLKPRHDRDKPNWPLAERAKEKLAERIGTPDLPRR